MTTYVLVHGANSDGSAWARVIEHLEHRGHRAFGPTAAGHGKGVPKDVSHAESTQSIVDFIVDKDLSDIVLVGHSYGGTIISKAAEVIPDRIRRLVFWSAFVLNDGEAMIDVFPPAERELFASLAAQSSDNTVTLSFDVWHQAFINDADLELARWSYEQLSPEPFEQLLEPLDLKKFYALALPASYLIGTEDLISPVGGWERMSRRLVHARVLLMPGSHELLFSNPIGLADKIIEAGSD